MIPMLVAAVVSSAYGPAVLMAQGRGRVVALMIEPGSGKWHAQFDLRLMPGERLLDARRTRGGVLLLVVTGKRKLVREVGLHGTLRAERPVSPYAECLFTVGGRLAAYGTAIQTLPFATPEGAGTRSSLMPQVAICGLPARREALRRVFFAAIGDSGEWITRYREGAKGWRKVSEDASQAPSSFDHIPYGNALVHTSTARAEVAEIDGPALTSVGAPIMEDAWRLALGPDGRTVYGYGTFGVQRWRPGREVSRDDVLLLPEAYRGNPAKSTLSATGDHLLLLHKSGEALWISARTDEPLRLVSRTRFRGKVWLAD